MLNMPTPAEAVESTASLAARIEANRDQLTRAAAQAGERHDIATIFGWAYIGL
ncbi:hypothetical protein IMZ11_39690 [Microtetraspora sp. AC03309]|uniref:hypothetical protein n=1 Tax=Microtetraspora sp. AC03309 TaxID=2779376 RepID=UPI001E38751D|nr:hypothetical protein [Microtetraspora sp. AC03309]MCC5581743.1 hypothetical protein [Microtetraspora sp. AC03309]